MATLLGFKAGKLALEGKTLKPDTRKGLFRVVQVGGGRGQTRGDQIHGSPARGGGTLRMDWGPPGRGP